MKNLIAFRPDSILQADFYRLVTLLGVTESEFVRRAVKHGMAKAFEELAAEQRKEAEGTLERLRTITLPRGRLGSIAPLLHVV